MLLADLVQMWNWEAGPLTQALAADKLGFSDLSYQVKESQTTPWVLKFLSCSTSKKVSDKLNF